MALFGLAADPAQAAGKDDIKVSAALSRDTIGLDEYAILEVEVSGNTQNLPKPNMPTLPMFEMYSQGQSSSISIVNGQVQSSVTYRYLIMPQKPGSWPIENISAVYQNRRYVGNDLTLTVLNQGSATSQELEQRAQDNGGKSKDYFLEAIVDNKTPYVNEQVTLTLKFYTAVQYFGSPQLSEPTTTGFWTEIIGNKAPYNQRINNRTYKVIERRYALFPTQTGSLTIGRAGITFAVASRNRSRRDPFDMFGFGAREQVQVRSQPIVIRVKPLPDDGRPSDFTGTIGKFSMTATADKTEVEVSQPITLRIEFSGVGNVKSIAEPQIPDLPEFRVYRASSNENISIYNDQIGGTKIYEEVFIPNRPGNLEIPGLTFNYFNTRTDSYETLRTQPIPIKVTKPEGWVASGDQPYAPSGVSIGAEAREIRFIKEDLGDVQAKGELVLTSPLYVGVNALPVLALLATLVVRYRREKLYGDAVSARARGAAKQARKRLTQAKSLARPGSAEGFYGECNLAVLAYIADKLNVSPHGLTSERVAQLLRDRNADEGLVEDTVAFLDHCAFARYAPGSSDQPQIDEALQRAEDIMVRLGEVKL
ncbi:hypothetical protein GF377_00965 [candidate division GN15 bacterium]|nr:hypothetical protein [candidate division GN15 bacterium]